MVKSPTDKRVNIQQLKEEKNPELDASLGREPIIDSSVVNATEMSGLASNAEAKSISTGDKPGQVTQELPSEERQILTAEASEHSGAPTGEGNMTSRLATTGDKRGDINAATTIPLERVRRAIQAFILEEDLSLRYDQAREFGLFNRAALEPFSLVAIRSSVDMVFPGIDQCAQPIRPNGTFVSYKAYHEDVVRPSGSLGRYLRGMDRSMVIFEVPVPMIPSALEALPRVQLPISAIVCDDQDGLEIWITTDCSVWKSHPDAQYGVLQTMLTAGIEGIVKWPDSDWLMPGSVPMAPSDPECLRRRLLFACRDPHPWGLSGSINELSGALY